MKNRKIIIPLVLLAIGGIIWGSVLINCSKGDKSTLKEKEKVIVHKIEQEDAHAGHNHGPTETGEIPKDATKLIEGSFTQPLFCNNKEAIIFTDQKGNQLYYQENSTAKPIVLLEKNSVGNNIAWSKDCQYIYFKEKTPDYKIIIKSVNVLTKEIKTLKAYPPLIELRSLSISDTVYYLDNKTLDIKAQFENKQWTISSEPGSYYKLLISPDNKYLVAHEGANIKLFKTNGEFVRDLGRGIATDWNPNSKQLVGFLDESADGYEITGSELYLFNIESISPVQLTFTPNAQEMWPVFKSNNEIIYTDEINNGLFSKIITNN